jgi:hypothetical protein
MFTILKKSFSIGSNVKDWLFKLDMETGARPRMFHFKYPFAMHNRLNTEEKWVGKVDRNAGTFDLQRRNVGIFNNSSSSFNVTGEVKPDGPMRVNYRLNWLCFGRFYAIGFLSFILAEISKDWISYALMGCAVMLQVLLLIREFNQVEEAVAEISFR